MKPQEIENIEDYTGLTSRETQTPGIWELLSPKGIPIYSVDLRNNGYLLRIGDIYHMQGLRGWAVLISDVKTPYKIHAFDPLMSFQTATDICLKAREEIIDSVVVVSRICITNKAEGEFYECK